MVGVDGLALPLPEVHKLTVDRVVSLMPGFVYVFNHTTYSNDYTNRSVGAQLGYSSEEIRTFGSQMMAQVVHPDDLHRLAEHMAQITRLEGDSSVSLDYRVLTKTGRQLWLRSVDTVFERAPDGRVLRHIGCATDVTIEKEAELGLAHMNRQLEEKVSERTRELAALNQVLESRILERTRELQDAVDELEQLTYIATHDLKVPVNNLCRLGLMLAESEHQLSPDQAEQVGWINLCTTQLSAKIQGLVLVAQIRLGSVSPSEPLVLFDVIESVVQEFAPVIEGDGSSMHNNIDTEITVDFVCSELMSILTSLIDNAVKYAETSRPLEITFHVETGADHVTLFVSDNGTGIDNERDSEKVFGLFQRAHKEPFGSGMSLYCARRMMLRRGGEMSVEGARGRGARFKLRFSKCEVG